MSRLRYRELQRTIAERKQEGRRIRMQCWSLEASPHRSIMGMRHGMIAQAISYALDWRLQAQKGTLLELEPGVITSPKEKTQALIHHGRFVIIEYSWRYYPPEWLTGQSYVYLERQGISPNSRTSRMIRKALRYACQQSA
jgi:hypothetical protein